eukprot:TRINITY_DN11793_c1_g1_i2.p2 TRINITY_DN11793_c1_g1~~TRINITY_DN11793_c1_g1_i2.p2  ORF type:complete len:120 (-),score=23.61 TRINITY_DN11793_c1_g1_i2:361-720(-)
MFQSWTGWSNAAGKEELLPSKVEFEKPLEYGLKELEVSVKPAQEDNLSLNDKEPELSADVDDIVKVKDSGKDVASEPSETTTSSEVEQTSATNNAIDAANEKDTPVAKSSSERVGFPFF